MRRIAAVLLATALAALASGCGVKHESIAAPGTASLSLMLDYLPNADHVGLYAAIANGDFRRAGLSVDVQTPSDPSSPLKLLAAGRVDLAISYEPELLLARDRGLRVVSVGAIVQKPLTSIISLPGAGITGAAGLRGKTIGTAGIPYQSAYLKTILGRAGVGAGSAREVNVGFNLVPALLSHKVDATLGAFWNYEGIQLAEKGRHPRIIHVEQAGVPTYAELVVVVRQDELRGSGGDRVRRFIQALGHGYAAARANPGKAVGQLVAANRGLDRKLQLASVRATLPYFFPAAGKPFGYQDPSVWDAYGLWMLRNHLVRASPNAGAALTNEFLAGQGV